MKTGSPLWFKEKANTAEKQEFRNKIEAWRESFLERFSPEKLSEMSGAELLTQVFGNDDSSMIRILMKNPRYRNFGACGDYKYLGIVYLKDDGHWVYNKQNKPVIISKQEAEEKAKETRDMLIQCTDCIEKIGYFSDIHCYESLEKQISHIFFYEYAWVLKYYQMVFPFVFPGMYEDNGKNRTILRAIEILGLRNHGNSKRLLNMGEISLFIRRCDVNNIIFNCVYADEWGWDLPKKICENAQENHSMCSKPSINTNVDYYILSDNNEQQKAKDKETIENIEKELDSLQLQGSEREAIVKIRTNQGDFRKRLLKRYNRCCLCGVSNQDLLIASHIKPWADSDGSEKLDKDNGFLLCPNHDKLFDKGFISFTENGDILISPQIAEVDKIFTNINPSMKIELKGKNAEYLKYHREHIFKKD